MDRIQFRRDTLLRWSQVNPVLLEGEVGYVLNDPNKYKIGDGVHAWNELPLRGFNGSIAGSVGDSEDTVISQKLASQLASTYNVSLSLPEREHKYYSAFWKRINRDASAPEYYLSTTFNVGDKCNMPDDSVYSYEALDVVTGIPPYTKAVDNKYNLSEAITALPASLRRLGMHICFINYDNEYEIWESINTYFTSTSGWQQTDGKHFNKKFSELESLQTKNFGGNVLIKNVVAYEDNYIKILKDSIITRMITPYSGKVYFYPIDNPSVPFLVFSKDSIFPITVDKDVYKIRGDISGEDINLELIGVVDNQLKELDDKSKNIELANLLPKPFVSSYKYMTNNTVGYIEENNNERIEAVKFQASNVAGSNVFPEFPDLSLSHGDYYAHILVKSSIQNSLRFIVFTNSSTYYEISKELQANVWTKIVLPIKIDSNSSTLDFRYDVTNNCELSLANPGLTKLNTDNYYIRDYYADCEAISKLDVKGWDKGGNLYQGIEVIGKYLDVNGAEVENEDWGISYPIVVKQNNFYTVSNDHNIIGYDADNNISFVHTTENIFNKQTIFIPYGVAYIKSNIRIDFDDSYSINKGEDISDNENYIINGRQIKDNSIEKSKLKDFKTEIEVGSVTIDMLSIALLSYLSDGNNLKDDSISLNKLSNAILNYLTNGDNIQDRTINTDKLSEELLQLIQSSGGGSITNNADGNTIKVDSLNRLFVDYENIGIFISKEGWTTQDVINKISSYNGKAILVLDKDLLIDNNYTNMPDNLYKVIGRGGKIIPYGTVTTYKYLEFPDGCIFECGKYQMFDKWVILSAKNDGFLQGTALTDWWGVEKDGVTDCTVSMSAFMASAFKNVRFTSGVYQSYPNNAYDNRNIYLDKDVIIDGVFHIAYGDYNEKTYCKNVNVYGDVVSTLRVGGAMIDGLNIHDSIHILARNSQYVNQTKEGGCKGVHFNFTNKNIYINKIIVDEIIPLKNEEITIISYGLGLDCPDDYEKIQNIRVNELYLGKNSSEFYDLMIDATCSNVSVGYVQCEGGDTQRSSLYINKGDDIRIGNYKTSTTKKAVEIISSSNISINKIIGVSNSNHGEGLSVISSEDIDVFCLRTSNYDKAIDIQSSKRLYIANHTSINDTIKVNNADGSTYNISNSFVE